LNQLLLLLGLRVEKNLVVVFKYSFSTLHQVYALVVDAVIKCGSIETERPGGGNVYCGHGTKSAK
jgi:hypothetical protein